MESSGCLREERRLALNASTRRCDVWVPTLGPCSFKSLVNTSTWSKMLHVGAVRHYFLQLLHCLHWYDCASSSTDRGEHHRPSSSGGRASTYYNRTTTTSGVGRDSTVGGRASADCGRDDGITNDRRSTGGRRVDRRRPRINERRRLCPHGHRPGTRERIEFVGDRRRPHSSRPQPRRYQLNNRQRPRNRRGRRPLNNNERITGGEQQLNLVDGGS